MLVLKVCSDRAIDDVSASWGEPHHAFARIGCLDPALDEPSGFKTVDLLGEAAGGDESVVGEFTGCPLERCSGAGEGGEHVELALAESELAVDSHEPLGHFVTTFDGAYFRVDSAPVWDLPDDGVPIGIAVSADDSVQRFAPLADQMIAVEPDSEGAKVWDKTHDDARSRKIGQVPISWDPDNATAIDRAYDQFRWFGGGWTVNADLPTTAGFEVASKFVRRDDIESSIVCGPDLDELPESVRPYLDAGFTDIAFVQIGDQAQARFLSEAAGPLLDEVRALAAR